jgi:hypothetical protein
VNKDLTLLAMHVDFDDTLRVKGVDTDWAYAEIVPPHTRYDEEPMVHYLHHKVQADSYIQHLLTTSHVDLAIGNDANFSFIAGAKCSQVSDFQIPSAGTGLTNNIETIPIS